LIRTRRRRPQTIHITAYPAGYIPLDTAESQHAAPRKKGKRGGRRESRLEQVLEQRGQEGREEAGRDAREPIPEERTDRNPASVVQQHPTKSSIVALFVRKLTTYWVDDAIDAWQMARPASMVALRPPLVNLEERPPSSLSLARPLKNTVSSMVSEVQKPVASGSGVSCSIVLAEPNVFLSGFDHDGQGRQNHPGSTALLRGKLSLNVTKNVKIKSVQLTLVGKARTEWPEGIPPLRLHEFEEDILRTQVLTFFNATNDGLETDYGNQCSYSLRSGDASANSSSTNLSIRSASTFPATSPLSLPTSRSPTPRELRRLSLKNTHSRSFGKNESPLGAAAATAKGYRVFYPGAYEYSFELPIDHHQLESAKLQYGYVKWELQAMIERAGAFKPNLHGTREVSIVRVPDQMSLETTEPISISRQWEDQLHYDIIISGKSFPIGSRIPIAFKLSPLAKVHLHKLKVYVTESIEYWTNDRRVTRKDPGRKICLLEKTAGRPLDAIWSSSQLRFTSGGELTPHQRREARESAAFRRSLEAARQGVLPQPLPDVTENLLGDLDLGLESYWGSTEIEANVQLPTCEMMAKNKNLRLHPDCSWKNVNVHHWIKVSTAPTALSLLGCSRLTLRRLFCACLALMVTIQPARAAGTLKSALTRPSPSSTAVPPRPTPACPSTRASTDRTSTARRLVAAPIPPPSCSTMARPEIALLICTSSRPRCTCLRRPKRRTWARRAI